MVYSIDRLNFVWLPLLLEILGNVYGYLLFIYYYGYLFPSLWRYKF